MGQCDSEKLEVCFEGVVDGFVSVDVDDVELREVCAVGGFGSALPVLGGGVCDLDVQVSTGSMAFPAEFEEFVAFSENDVVVVGRDEVLEGLNFPPGSRRKSL